VFFSYAGAWAGALVKLKNFKNVYRKAISNFFGIQISGFS